MAELAFAKLPATGGQPDPGAQLLQRRLANWPRQISWTPCMLAWFAEAIRPEVRPLRNEQESYLVALITRRRQVIDILTAEKESAEHLPRVDRPSSGGTYRPGWNEELDLPERRRLVDSSKVNPAWQEKETPCCREYALVSGRLRHLLWWLNCLS